jgi:hypothetical protein
MAEFPQRDVRIANLDNYLHAIIRSFESRYPGIQLRVKPESAALAIGIYSDYIHPRLKQFARDKINIYKIAASHELALIKIQPLELVSDHAVDERHINAELAFSAAISNIECLWNACGGDPDDFTPEEVQDKSPALHTKHAVETHPKLVNHVFADKMLEIACHEHIEWLAHKDPNEIPVHIAASFLRLYYGFQQLNFIF